MSIELSGGGPHTGLKALGVRFHFSDEPTEIGALQMLGDRTEPANAMIVRGRTLPAPPAPLKQFFGGGEPAARRVSVAGLDAHFIMHPEISPFLTVGRSADCDIRLPHEDVSYRHAHLQLISGQIYCIDLASRTGTLWDGAALNSGWLMPGGAIGIGPFSLSTSGDAHDSHHHVTGLNLLSLEVADPQIELELLNGKHLSTGSKFWEVRQPITLIGNSPRCRLRLTDGSVSRVHCSLLTTPVGVWVTDLLGRGGTRVNGEPVTFQLLRHNDELRVGRFRFGIRYRHPLDLHESPSRQTRPVASLPTAPIAPPAQSATGNAGLSESFMLSMMDRFLEMQQQMTAINHQQMMFMAQMVGSMHQNHHELVQRELSRIAELGEEIAKLQEKAAAEGDSAAADETPAARLEARPANPVPQNLLESFVETPVAPQPPAARLPEDVPATVETPPLAAAQQQRFTQSDVSCHSTLIERMAALEKERNSRWKKLMRILTGSGP